MSRTKKIISVLVLVIILIVAGVVSSRETARGDVVRVGVITPLTGQYAMFGEVNKNAAMLAQSDFKGNVEVYIEDDAYDVKKAVSAYKKLRAVHKVDAVIVLGAPSIQAIKPLTDQDNIPLLGLGVTLVYEKDSVFQLMPSGDSVLPEQGKLYSEKYNRIFVVHSTAELFKNNARNFVTGMDKADLLGLSEVQPAIDYRTEVSKVLAYNPEVIYASLPIDDALKFVKELNAQDVTRKVGLVCDFHIGLSFQKYIEVGGKDRIEGCILIQNAVTTDPVFKERYMNTFNSELILTGDYTYDAIGMISSLAKKYPVSEWVQVLSSVEYEYPSKKGSSVSGKIKFNTDGTRLDERLTKKIFRNGAFEDVE